MHTSAKRYELLGCALHGHAVVGTDAAAVREVDALVVRDDPGGGRWHRCLRCDSWEHRHRPAAPEREHVPGPDEIEVPLRGRPLRDRFVLRLIAVDRIVHVVAFVLVGVAILVLLGHRQQWAPIVWALRGLLPASTVVHEAERVLGLSRATLGWFAAAAFAYALLEAVEAVGLWYARRWAEYLTFTATSILLVPEIYELAHGASPTKIIALVVNVAVVIYLLVAKRLFGIRGGGRAEEEVRARDTGWAAVARAGPPAPADRTVG